MSLHAVPYFRSGVLLKFPVERSAGALLTVRLENGEPLPVGAMVEVAGQEGTYPAAMNGEVYVTRLAPANHLRARWQKGVCDFDVTFAPTDDPLPHLGPFTCKASEP